MDRPLDDFFARHTYALTFDDVRLKTGRQTAELLPDQVSVSSWFTRNVPLLIPLASAAMDTVTESSMAIAMAMAGGIGVIHRNLSPKDQAREVARTKFAANGIIDRPICVQENQTIGDILAMRRRKRYPFHSFPVLNRRGKLVGILTQNDFDICYDPRLPAKQVMTTKLVTAPATISLDQAYERMQKTKKKVLLLLDRRGNLAGLCSFNDLQRIKSGRSTLNVDERGQPRVAAAVGTGTEEIARARLLLAKRVDVLIIDTAHADSRPVYQAIKQLRRLLAETESTADIMVGNVSEPESARRLVEAGVDGLKVGQGPGSICTTRIIAGVGCPQVTAIWECALMASPHEIPVCADGGIKHPGDIPIGIGAGASSVMMGSVLAGTDEAPGEVILYQGRQWKGYRGMGSLSALRERAGSRQRYLQTATAEDMLVPEGVDGLVPYKGPAAAVIHQFCGGLRKGMGYVGAGCIPELQRLADFRLLTSAGKEESHVHDVVVTQEAPNYSRRS